MKLRFWHATPAVLLAFFAIEARADALITVATTQGPPAVFRYSDAGTFIGVFGNTAGNRASATESLGALVQGPTGDLYTTANGLGQGAVFRFNGTTGAFVDQFVPYDSHGLNSPEGLTFGPDGNLYVSSTDVNAGSGSVTGILRYNGTTGTYIDTFVAAGSDGLQSPDTIGFGPDGDLYVVNRLSNSQSILRYSNTGASLGTFITDGTNGLDLADGFTWGSDGDLYVSSLGNNSVLRYDGATGDYLNTFVTSGSGGLNQPGNLLFGPDNDLYVYNTVAGSVLRYDGQTGQFLNTFLTNAGSPYAESDAQMIFASVPEPSSCALLSLGVATLLLFRILRRRRGAVN